MEASTKPPMLPQRRDSFQQMLEMEKRALIERIKKRRQQKIDDDSARPTPASHPDSLSKATKSLSRNIERVEGRREGKRPFLGNAIFFKRPASSKSGATTPVETPTSPRTSKPILDPSLTISVRSSNRTLRSPKVSHPKPPNIPPRLASLHTPDYPRQSGKSDGHRRWFETPTPPESDDADSDAPSSICRSPSWDRYRRDQKKPKKQRSKPQRQGTNDELMTENSRPRDGGPGQSLEAVQPYPRVRAEPRKKSKLTKPPPLSRGFPAGRSSSVPPVSRGLFRRRLSSSEEPRPVGEGGLVNQEASRHSRRGSISDKIRRSFEVTRVSSHSTYGFVGGVKLDMEQRAIAGGTLTDDSTGTILQRTSTPEPVPETLPETLESPKSPATVSNVQGLTRDPWWRYRARQRGAAPSRVRRGSDAPQQVDTGDGDSPAGFGYGLGSSSDLDETPRLRPAPIPSNAGKWAPKAEDARFLWLQQTQPSTLLGAGCPAVARSRQTGHGLDQPRPRSSPAAATHTVLPSQPRYEARVSAPAAMTTGTEPPCWIESQILGAQSRSRHRDNGSPTPTHDGLLFLPPFIATQVDSRPESSRSESSGDERVAVTSPASNRNDVRGTETEKRTLNSHRGSRLDEQPTRFRKRACPAKLSLETPKQSEAPRQDSVSTERKSDARDGNNSAASSPAISIPAKSPTESEQSPGLVKSQSIPDNVRETLGFRDGTSTQKSRDWLSAPPLPRNASSRAHSSVTLALTSSPGTGSHTSSSRKSATSTNAAPPSPSSRPHGRISSQSPRPTPIQSQPGCWSAPELVPPLPPRSTSRPKSSQSSPPLSHEIRDRRQRLNCPEEPLAKMLVECCECRFYHDMPSRLYECMAGGDSVVEGRAAGVAIRGTVATAVRCPWCGHGMTARCCAGYAAVVYLKERLH